MALWGDATNFFSGGGQDDMNNAYNQANGYLRPYQQGGANSYNQMQNYNNTWQNNLQPFNTAGNYQYSQINQSPTDYYNSIMKNYTMSPSATYNMNAMTRASNNAASASGMLGSGAQERALQENANQISQGDQNQFFNNVTNANTMQMGYLDNLQQQQAQQRMMMQYLTGLGYGAAGGLSGNAINQGGANARYDQGAFDDIAGVIGSGIQYFGNQNQNQNGLSSPDVSKLPMYMQKAIYGA